MTHSFARSRPFAAALAALLVVATGCTPALRADEVEVATLRLHLHAAELAVLGADVLRGDEDLGADLDAELAGVKRSLDRIRAAGDAMRADKLAPFVERVGVAVSTLRKAQPAVLEAADAGRSAAAAVPQLSAQLGEVVRAMSETNSKAAQINIANRQIVLADRMSRRVTEIFAGGEVSVMAAEALSRDLTVFKEVLGAFRNGNAEIGIPRVASQEAQAALARVSDVLVGFDANVQTVLAHAPAIAEAEKAASTLHGLRYEMLDAARPRD